MSDDNKNTQSNKLTLEKVIKFYMSKEEHYDNVKEYMEKNPAKDSEGYKKLFNVFSYRIFKDLPAKDDVYFCYLIHKYLEIRKDYANREGNELWNRLCIFDRMNEEEILCKKNKVPEPNQKWHLLISFCAYKKLLEKKEINGIKNNVFFDENIYEDGQIILSSATPFAINQYKQLFLGINHVPLKLWMYEAAADTKNQHIITPDIIEELSKDINEGRATKGGYNWGKYWNDIVKIIDAWEEET